MTNRAVAHRCGVGLALLACSLTQALAQTPPDLEDLVGARGAGGETQMEARGYQFIRAHKVRDQSWTFWWSDVQRACVAISTLDGRYASINRVPPANCKPGEAAAQAPVAPTPPPALRADTLALSCYGQGHHVASAPHSGLEWDSKRKSYESTQRIETETEQFQTGVDFEFEGGAGRVRLAGKMVPPLHSGGRDGWWQLEDVQMTPDRITAHYRLNGLSKPSVSIDRRTGVAEIKGSPGFSGKCEARGAAPRF